MAGQGRTLTVLQGLAASFAAPHRDRDSAKPARSKTMTATHDRDIEKGYPTTEFVAKLRRLADCLESGENFEIQVAGERIYVPDRAVFHIEHEREGDGQELEFQIKWGV